MRATAKPKRASFEVEIIRRFFEAKSAERYEQVGTEFDVESCRRILAAADGDVVMACRRIEAVFALETNLYVEPKVVLAQWGKLGGPR